MDPQLDIGLQFSAPFGAVLRAVRRAVGWTQVQLAVEVHRDHTYVSRWETGALVPSADDLAWLESVLPVDASHLALLRNAWLRSQQPEPTGALSASVDEAGLSVEAVRALRHLGQPRVAYQLAARDARQVLAKARTTPMTDGQLHGLLTVASELLLEETKAALDFATGGWVRDGLLAVAGREHDLVAAALGDRLTLARHGLAREATLYAVGETAAAHREALALRGELTVNEPEWLAETIRATAINGGLLGDHQGVCRAWTWFETVAADLAEDQRCFVLEGFVRGFAGHDPERAFELLDSAYEMLAGLGQRSPVRWVQLVRSESKLQTAVSGGLAGKEGVQAKVEDALERSRALGLPKYVTELEALLRTAG